MFHRILQLFAFTVPLLAQDGGQLFTLHCSACHALDGKGATGGAFPPLAGSPWVAGDADRAVKIALKGLTGPVEVSGKTYNLEMPPQGAVIPDDQIAAILTFVRSSWGNNASPVTEDFVKTIRASVEDRKTPWTAEEILKLHPLPLERTPLTNLISQVYRGKWDAFPDFSTLKPESAEERHNGIISLADSPIKNEFAMTWKGSFEAPTTGEYTFVLDVDDAAMIRMDGKPFLQIDGSGPMNGSRLKRAKIQLTQGPHPFSVEYLEVGGNQGLAIGWKGPGIKSWKWLTDTPAMGPAIPSNSIPIEPTGGRPAIYRNFIAGTTPRAICFGFPGGLNLAYSADNLAPELIWTGAFMDGGLHWTDRGMGNQVPPAGDDVIRLSKSRALPATARFRGYKLDPEGNPIFSVQIGEQFLLDSWRADSGTLVRKLTVTVAPLEIQIPQAEGITIDGTGGKTTLTLTPGQTITLTYRWN